MNSEALQKLAESLTFSAREAAEAFRRFAHAISTSKDLVASLRAVELRHRRIASGDHFGPMVDGAGEFWCQCGGHHRRGPVSPDSSVWKCPDCGGEFDMKEPF